MSIKRKKYHRDILQQLPRLLLACSMITAVVTGILIACYYIPVPEKAMLSLRYLQENVFAGAMVVSIHQIAGILALLFVLCNLILILPAKKISDIWTRVWHSGWIVMLLFICLQITGYFLTGDTSTAYLAKSGMVKFFGANTDLSQMPQLWDTLPLFFVRIYEDRNDR